MIDSLFQCLKSIGLSKPLPEYVLSGLNGQSLPQKIVENGLGSLIYPLVKDKRDLVNGDTIEYFRTLCENALIHRELAVQTLRHLAEIIGCHTHVVILQGLALAHDIYTEPWFREMSDIDLYVPGKNMADISSLLHSMEFERYGNYSSTWRNKSLCIDIHDCFWGEDRIFARKWIAPHLDLHFEQSRLVPGFLIPDNSSLFLLCSFHGLKHGFGRALWLLDILKMWRLGNCNKENISGQAGKIISYSIRHLCSKGLISRNELENIFSEKETVKSAMIRKILSSGIGEGKGEIVLALACRTWLQTGIYFIRSLFPPIRVLREMYGYHSVARLISCRSTQLFIIFFRFVLNRRNRNAPH